MTTKEFLVRHNSAAYALYEIAELASEVSDDEDVANTAKFFLEAKENFELVLDTIGFEPG